MHFAHFTLKNIVKVDCMIIISNDGLLLAKVRSSTLKQILISIYVFFVESSFSCF